MKRASLAFFVFVFSWQNLGYGTTTKIPFRMSSLMENCLQILEGVTASEVAITMRLVQQEQLTLSQTTIPMSEPSNPESALLAGALTPLIKEFEPIRTTRVPGLDGESGSHTVLFKKGGERTLFIQVDVEEDPSKYGEKLASLNFSLAGIVAKIPAKRRYVFEAEFTKGDWTTFATGGEVEFEVNEENLLEYAAPKLAFLREVMSALQVRLNEEFAETGVQISPMRVEDPKVRAKAHFSGSHRRLRIVGPISDQVIELDLTLGEYGQDFVESSAHRETAIVDMALDLLNWERKVENDLKAVLDRNRETATSMLQGRAHLKRSWMFFSAFVDLSGMPVLVKGNVEYVEAAIAGIDRAIPIIERAFELARGSGSEAAFERYERLVTYAREVRQFLQNRGGE